MSKPDEFAKKLLVFLNHAIEDKPKVRELYKKLMQDGFEPWLDEEELLPGQNWDLEIKKALRSSQSIIICLSKTSVSKEGYVNKEIKRALDIADEKPEGEIFVIPVLFSKCEIPFWLQDRHLQFVEFPSQYDKLVRALNLRINKVTPKI